MRVVSVLVRQTSALAVKVSPLWTETVMASESAFKARCSRRQALSWRPRPVAVRSTAAAAAMPATILTGIHQRRFFFLAGREMRAGVSVLSTAFSTVSGAETAAAFRRRQ